MLVGKGVIATIKSKDGIVSAGKGATRQGRCGVVRAENRVCKAGEDF